MELIPAILLGLVGLSTLAPPLLLAALQLRAARQRRKRWYDAARQVGLVGVERAGDLIARVGAFSLRLSAYGEQLFSTTEPTGTRIEVTGAGLAPGLTLCPEGEGMLFTSRHPKEIEIGDEYFDRLVSVQGPPALALALLDADIRRTVNAMLSGRLELRGHRPLWASGRLREGVLWVDLPQRVPQLRWQRGHEELPQAGNVYLDGECQLPAVLRATLDLAARLVEPADLASRIASNLAREPAAGVRLKALQTLLREFPKHNATREAVRVARADPDAEVRVRAGIALGPDGRDVLVGVASGEGAEDRTSARAVNALDSSLTIAQAADLLKSALRTRRLQTAKACLRILGQRGDDATPVLGRVLLVEKGEVGEAAAHALGSAGHSSAEAPLLRALAEGAPELRRAAAAALGRVGTRDAVLPLREAEADAELRGIARQAIAQIHSRLAGADKGQLSLAGGESGWLSIAEDERGHLSLSDTAWKPKGS